MSRLTTLLPSLGLGACGVVRGDDDVEHGLPLDFAFWAPLTDDICKTSTCSTCTIPRVQRIPELLI